MTHNPLASRPRVVIPPRKPPTKAEKVAAWNAANGLCYLCGKPVAPEGAGVEYDHEGMRAITGDDSVANLRPTHERCHTVKTSEHDAPLIAKVRRQVKMTGAKIEKASGFRKHPTHYRGIDGQVRERRR